MHKASKKGNFQQLAKSSESGWLYNRGGWQHVAILSPLQTDGDRKSSRLFLRDGRVASLQVEPGDLPELQLICRLQRLDFMASPLSSPASFLNTPAFPKPELATLKGMKKLPGIARVAMEETIAMLDFVESHFFLEWLDCINIKIYY